MEESIVEAQKAAVEFLKDVMTKRDRSFLVTFDNEPQLVSRFTTDRDKLAQALAGLRAQGSTALWDALVYGLYQYQGTKGRKAYVILTDGEDRCSHFTFDAALDYAKKTGVAVYFIGLRIGSTQLDVRHKLGKIARETGGTVYYVDNAKRPREDLRGDQRGAAQPVPALVRPAEQVRVEPVAEDRGEDDALEPDRPDDQRATTRRAPAHSRATGTGAPKRKPCACRQPFASEERELLLGLDALGDDAQAEAPRHLEDRHDERRVRAASRAPRRRTSGRS